MSDLYREIDERWDCISRLGDLYRPCSACITPIFKVLILDREPEKEEREREREKIKGFKTVDFVRGLGKENRVN